MSKTTPPIVEDDGYMLQRVEECRIVNGHLMHRLQSVHLQGFSTGDVPDEEHHRVRSWQTSIKGDHTETIELPDFLTRCRPDGIEAEAIGGLTLGADPIAAAVAVVSEVDGTPLPAFIVRKETKKHGARRQIEGWTGSPGSRVIVVDDVCTSGGSILEACDKVEAEGYTVAATLCVVDREEGGTEAVRSRYPFYPIITAKDLLSGVGTASS